MKANRDHASFLHKARFFTTVNINTRDGLHDVWPQETSESMYICFTCNVKNGSKSRMHTVQCPYTYEQKQHISKTCNSIPSISNSLIAAVVKRLRSVSSDNKVYAFFFLFANLSMTACAFTGISRWMCKSASPVSRPRPSLIRSLSHVFSSLVRVEKQSWCDKFVIWE